MKVNVVEIQFSVRAYDHRSAAYEGDVHQRTVRPRDFIGQLTLFVDHEEEILVDIQQNPASIGQGDHTR